MEKLQTERRAASDAETNRNKKRADARQRRCNQMSAAAESKVPTGSKPGSNFGDISLQVDVGRQLQFLAQTVAVAFDIADADAENLGNFLARKIDF